MRVIPNWLSSTVITQIFWLSPSLKELALQRHEWSFPLKNNNLQITFVLQSLERCPLRIQLKRLPNVTNDCLRSWKFLTFLHSSWLCAHRQKSQLICFPVCIDVFLLNSSWGFLVFRGFLWYSSRSSTSWPKMSESGSKFHSWWSSPLVMVRRSCSGSFSNNDGTTMAEYVSWSHQVVPRPGAWSRRSRTRLEASVHLVRYRWALCSWGLWCAFFGWQSFFHNFSLAAPSLLYNLLT